MGLYIRLDTPCGTGRFVVYRTNKRFRQHAWFGSAPAACSNVEDYQIAFLCDNLFLLYVASEITLANPRAKTDETPVSLEN